jgi:hypothetical protein
MGNKPSSPDAPPDYNVTDMSKAEFELFLGFFDTIGDKYKQGLEKYVKQMEYKDSSGNEAYKTSAPWYGPIKQAIPNLYGILKGGLARKTIWIPSIQWINFGITLPDNAEYVINLGYKDTPGTIGKTAVGHILDLQHHFESEVFAPTLASLKNEYREKIAIYLQRRAAQQGATTDPVKLHAEYERQKAEGVKLHVSKGEKQGYEVLNVATVYPTNYDAWLDKFKKSKEWKEYLGAQSKEIEKAYSTRLKNAEKTRQEGLQTGTFHMGKIFEDMDQDSINFDVIRKLQLQEEEFNRALNASKASLDESLAAHKAELATGLQQLRDRITAEKQNIFDSVDQSIAKNESNAEKRANLEKRKQKENEDIIEEQRALASLKNYTSCSSSSNQERANRVRDEVYEDDDIQAIIDAKTQHILTGKGKTKKISIGQQMYLLNKKFIDHNEDGEGHITTSSASKRLVGGDDDGMTDLEKASLAMNVAGAVFPGLAIIGAILDIVSVFDNEARAAAEKKRLEEEARQDRLFDAWKGDAIATTVATLEGETDENMFEVRKMEMINNLFETSTREITQDDLDDLIQDIDDAHERTMEQRKEILDTIAENANNILGEGQNLIDDYSDSMEQANEDDNKARDEIMKPFIEELSAKAEQYRLKEEHRDEITKKEQEYQNRVNEKLNEEYDKIDEERDEIAQLKGYKGCATTTTNEEAIKSQVRDEIDRENKRREEEIAQGQPVQPQGQPTVGTGAGRSNRAQIVKRIMQEKGLSMIEASKYVKQKGLYKK